MSAVVAGITRSALLFTACMVARQYRVTLPVRARGERGHVDVWSLEMRREEEVLGDFLRCRTMTAGVVDFATCLIGRRYVAVPLGHH